MWARELTLCQLFFYFLAKVVEVLVGMVSGLVELVLIDDACDEKINQCLYPQGDVFGLYILECGTHGVDAHIGSDAEGRGEEHGHAFPYARDVALGP